VARIKYRLSRRVIVTTDELFGMVLCSLVWNVCERGMDFRTKDYCSITSKFLNSNEFPYQFVHIIYTMLMKNKNLRLLIWNSQKYRSKLHNLSRRFGVCPKVLCAVCNKLMQYKGIRYCPRFPHGTNFSPPHIAILQYVIFRPNQEMASLQSQLCGYGVCHVL
jgi:hypothetical protein